jgi:hypothetical protein
MDSQPGEAETKVAKQRIDVTLTVHKFLTSIISDMLETVAVYGQMLDIKECT